MSRKKREAVARAAEANSKKDGARTKFTSVPKISIAAVLLLLAVFGAAAGVFTEQFKTAFASGKITSVGRIASLPTPTPTPQLAKEYVYAGAKMLAIEEPSSAVNQNPTDLVVWRLTSGTGYWYVQDGQNSSGMLTSVFGSTNDIPAPADFDGDGLYDFCVFRPNYPSSGDGTWFVQPNNGGTAFTNYQFGIASDKPVPADYDGDGKADYAVWRSGSTAYYYIVLSATNTLLTQSSGTTGDLPVPFDFDGDGKADPTVFRASNASWIIKRSSDSQTSTQTFGATSGEPVPGDYDGDGKFDLATRDSSNSWSVKQSSTGNTINTTWGLSADKAVPGDYDQDGKTDIAVWRPSNGYWFINQSTTGTMRSEPWGMNGDTPIAAPFKR